MSVSTFHVSLQEYSVVRLTAKLWTSAAISKRLAKTNLIQYKSMPSPLVNAVKMKVIDLSTLNAESKNKIQSLIKPVGDSLLTWIKGHYEFFNSIEDAISFCCNLCWLPDGTIDNRATAEIVLENNEVDVVKRFVLACIYCFEQHILRFWQQLKLAGIVSIDKKFALKYPLANYWLEFLTNKNLSSLDLNTDTTIPSPKSPSQSSEIKVDFLVEDASECVHTVLDRCSMAISTDSEKKCRSLPKLKHCVPGVSAVPNKKVVKILDTKCFCQKAVCPQDNLMDVLLNYAIQGAVGKEPWTDLGFKYGEFVQLLFSLANIRQRINKMELKYESKNQEDCKPPTCFLEWPLQWFFLDILTDKWVFLTIEMCQLQFGKLAELLEVAKKDDYRKIFLQIWNNTEISRWALKAHSDNNEGLEKLCGIMPWDMLQAQNFTNKKLLADTHCTKKSEAMAKIYSSVQQLIVIQKLDFIQELIEKCLPTSNEFSQCWKSEFMFSFDGLKTVASLIQRGKWEALETLLTWSLPNPHQISDFNRFFINSQEGCKLCMNFVATDDWVALKDLLSKSLTSEDDMKKNLRNNVDLFFDYAEDNNWKAVEKNLMWCLFDAQDIKEFRIKFVEKCTKSEIWSNPKLKTKEAVKSIFARLMEAKGPEYYQETLLITFILFFILTGFYFLR